MGAMGRCTTARRDAHRVVVFAGDRWRASLTKGATIHGGRLFPQVLILTHEGSDTARDMGSIQERFYPLRPMLLYGRSAYERRRDEMRAVQLRLAFYNVTAPDPSQRRTSTQPESEPAARDEQ